MVDLAGLVRHPLDPAPKTGSVLVFYAQDCPACNGYAPEINRLAATHTNFAFHIVQVDPELTPAAARAHARKYDLHPPVLLDPGHLLVKAASATVTPEAVVFDRSGAVVYRGRIDNAYASLGRHRAVVTEHDLAAVLTALEAHQPPPTRETEPVGCLIP